MRLRLVLLGAAGLLGLGAGAMTLLGHSGAAQQPARPVPAVQADPVGVGALGRVEPASRVRKLNQPGGFSVTRVDRLLVAEGERVAAGQVLAVLADAPQKDATVAQSEAAVSEARAALEKTRAAGRPSEIAAQRARIEALVL